MRRPCRLLHARTYTTAGLFLSWLLLTATSFAQTPTATVTGTVLDTTGGGIPDATVTAVNQATNVRSEKKTAADGTFTILNLLPGDYVLTVEKEGFKKAALPPFKLDVNQKFAQTITLAVGSATETVTISADAIDVMVQRASTELGTTISETMVHELPMNGRNFSQLLVLQPGVNPMDTSQGNSAGRTNAGGADGGNIAIPGSTIYKVSVNGQGNRYNTYYMDGIINTDDRGGGWSVPPIADTIQEMKVQSHNNDVQYANVLGSVVNLVTKSGTNNFHGSAWEFARSQIFDARNPFTGFCTAALCPTLASNLNGQVAAGTQTAAGAAAILSGTPVSPIGYSQHEFGGTFGGHIIKDKTFFYAAYEGWRYSVPTNTFAIVPTPEELGGDFTGKVSPELIGTVNSTKTGITPNTIYNPFAETGPNSTVPFTCDQTGSPMPLQNPGAAFGTLGYGIQAAGGTPCNKIPAGLIDKQLVSIIQAYTGTQGKNCAFTPNYVSAVYNCLDSRSTVNNANNYDFRIDHHFSEKNMVFARAYLMWNDNNGIVAGTSSITPSPFHVWNIGGAWDHIFTPNLILSVRGGINSRPATVNPTNSLGLKPFTDAGYKNLDTTQGFFLNVGGYIGSANSGIGNVGPQLRANPEHNVNASLAWTHGKHNLSFGG
ncbi:MAG TPA: carboxypeptidase-like regulatory domain-containing protein, partial [Candidatus Acidoferrales bacterium]|nr:carboxypeptidase-like regulatory domain-containing protein [Candidatus Acidoferrales bacterium]